MTVLAGTSKGLFRLAGGTFDRVQISRGVRDLFHFGSRTLAGTGDGLFVSDDDGRSWTASGLEGLEVWQIRSGGDTVLYAGTQPAGLYRSFDAGDSWEEVASFATVANSQPWCIPVTPALPGRARALVIDPVNPLRICVGVEVGGIVRTEDGGENWEIVLPGDNPDLHMMCTDPSDPDTVLSGPDTVLSV